MTKAGFPVPDGFCVTTFAYQDFMATSPEMDAMLDELNAVNPNDLPRLRKLGERIRAHIRQLDIPVRLAEQIVQAWEKVGKEYAYAVRSSATAEDLPAASFAGQQDTFLNIRGQDELLRHVRKCWASLFTDRAISYRSKNGFDHRQVYLSVVVQRMVNPEISGIMFTADPASGNRQIISIDAGFGLGGSDCIGNRLTGFIQGESGTDHRQKNRRKENRDFFPAGRGNGEKGVAP
nr:PEP/pyruvate-binding domain-containing protein [Thermoactinomyces sp. CICC 10521]